MDADSRRRASRNVESLELTEEERKVLRECRKNSMMRALYSASENFDIWYKFITGVPTGILSAILTSFAVRSVSFTGGLLFGVASYRKTCLEKIMKLENSVLADQVREYYRRAGMEVTGAQAQRRDSEFDETAVGAHDNTDDRETKFDEENIPYSSRLQDEEKTTLAGRQKPEETKHRLSFEERRRQHRQEWTMNRYPPIRSMRKVEDEGKRTQSDASDHNLPPLSTSDQGSTAPVRRNIYGDPIE